MVDAVVACRNMASGQGVRELFSQNFRVQIGLQAPAPFKRPFCPQVCSQSVSEPWSIVGMALYGHGGTGGCCYSVTVIAMLGSSH